nr:glycosyltransferase [Synechococcus sp. WH 8109]
MREIRVLVPGTGPRFRCGGLNVAKQTASLLSQIRTTTLVTYRERSDKYPFFDSLLLNEQTIHDDSLWIVCWGFDIPRLVNRLRGRKVVYQAHSTGYGFNLPPSVPIVAVSRNTMGYWGHRAPRNPIFLIPNALESQWLARGDRNGSVSSRPIDILVQKRKSSNYLLYELVPALRAKGFYVEIQNDWVDDLVHLFNSTKVFLYDSTEHWTRAGVSEGFGLPPLEAMSCGCIVFSSLNHALADTFTPGVVGHQIGYGCLSNDVDRIAAAVANPDEWKPLEPALDFALRDFSEPLFIERWRAVLKELDSVMPTLINNPRLLLKPSYGLALLLKYFKQALRRILDFFGF